MWYVQSKPFAGSPLRPKNHGCHGTTLETHGTWLSSQASHTGFAVSGVPAVSDRVPSSLSDSDTEVSPPMLNQKPEATPRPWFFSSGVRQCAWLLAASSVSTMPIGPNFGPYAALVPSLAAFLRRSSIGSMPILPAISSMTLSTANSEIGPPGAR